MERTPLKARGKRRKLDDQSEAKLKNSQTSFRKSQAQSSVSKKRARKLSQLELLPPEILERILLDSMNISLPLSSHYIGARLSSRYVYVEFMMRTLLPKRPGRGEPPQFLDRHLQTRLLQCKFFDLALLRAYFTRILRLGYQVEERGLDVPDDLDIWRENPPEIIENPRAYACSIPQLISLRNTRLPSKVLTGPWTDEKASLLRLLAWLGATIDWTQSSAGQIAKMGLFDAIYEGCEMATSTILEVCGVKPTTEMYLMALRHYPADPRVLLHIIFWDIFRDKTINYRSPKIWGLPAGDKLGEERLYINKRFMKYRDEITERVFFDGSIIQERDKSRKLWPRFLHLVEILEFTVDLVPPLFARNQLYC